MSGVLNNGLPQNTKQVTFNPNPVTIPSTSSATNTTTSSIKGTIPIADMSDPSKIKNVLVSVPTSTAETKVTTDHTYAKVSSDKEDSSSSSDDSSSDSESDSMDTSKQEENKKTIVMPKTTAPPPALKAMPTIATTAAVTPPIAPKRRGRPRKYPLSAPPKVRPTPRSILKQPTTPTTALSADTTPSAPINAKPEIKDLNALNAKIRRRGRGCGTCFGCAREDCGKCSYCLDKPKYGGPGRKKQRCALRICSQFVSYGKRPAPNLKSPLTMPLIAAAISSSTPDIVLSPTTALQHINVPLPITTDLQLPRKPITPPTIMQIQRPIPKSDTPPVPVPVPVSTVPSLPVAPVTSAPITLSQPSLPTTTADTISTPPGRTKGGVTNDVMKCIVCERERKTNLAKSPKFCTTRCLNLWVECNPGKNIDEAEANSSIPLVMPPTTTIGTNTPRAIKKLHINMALPGTSTSQPGNITSAVTSNITTDPLNSNKRPPQEQPILPASKRLKESPAATSVVNSTKTVSSVDVISKASLAKQKKKGPNDFPLDVSKWTTTDVLQHFETKPDCQTIAPLLEEQEIDGQALLLLTHDSLVKCLGIKLGPALKIMIHIDRLKQQQMTHTL